MRKLTIGTILLFAAPVAAHPSITSGPAFSSTSGQLVTFGISHGCDHKDTVAIQIDIPENISSIRPLYGPGEFGEATVTKQGNDVTSVKWEKANFAPDDSSYPTFTLRLRVGDVPFTTIPFSVTQTCRDDDGEVTIEWDDPDDSQGQAAPRLTVVPPRTPGWNKYTLPVTIAEADIPTFFGDAQIVWKGTAAYSPNAAVAALIGMTPGVTALSGDLAAGDELWVKY